MTKAELRADVKAAVAKKTLEERKESLLCLLEEMAERAAEEFKTIFIKEYLGITKL